MRDGKITRIDLNHSAYGVSVRQSCTVDGRTFEVVYAHGESGSVNVELGEPVKAGDILMRSDATGSVFGSGDKSHLHTHVKELGVTYTDPNGVAWPFNITNPNPLFGIGALKWTT